MVIYIAGKISNDSSFGRHHWRDEFCDELSRLSGKNLKHLDPLKHGDQHADWSDVFAVDCLLVKRCDAFIVYLSDDISVGGSQEILIAKYFGKPVIGYAPKGGKFNGRSKEMLGKTIENYKDPFVFSTCDVVCGTLGEVAEAIKALKDLKPKSITLIDEAVDKAARNIDK